MFSLKRINKFIEKNHLFEIESAQISIFYLSFNVDIIFW